MNATGVARALADISKEDDADAIDSGITTFMVISAALVQFMTPGLGLFYAGMVGSKSTVQLLFQSWICLGVIVCLWNVCGFSLTFGEPWFSWNGYHILGDPSTYFFLSKVDFATPLHRGDDILGTGFPGLLFCAYLGTFAVISPALLSGAVVDRVRFPVFVVLAGVWSLVVYAPVGYWNWGGGWMVQMGAWDFAGGLVVHESAGFSALGLLMVLGNRVVPPRAVERVGTDLNDGTTGGTYNNLIGIEALGDDASPHNLPLILLGTAMLWFGWFGFNCGSAFSAGRAMVVAFMNTLNAPAAAMVTWVAIDRFTKGKPSLIGACSGVVAGLVTITPAAGYVKPQFGLLAGVVGASICYPCTIIVKQKLKLDDTCDAVGIHGVGGFVGTILVGVLSDDAYCLDPKTADRWCVNPGTVARSWEQVRTQALCGIFVAVYSFVMSILLVKAIFCFTPKLDTYTTQLMALDVPSFNEVAYKHLNGAPVGIVANCSDAPSATDEDWSRSNSPDSKSALTASARAMNMFEAERSPRKEGLP